MKKNYLMMAAFATALAFTACSNEDEMPVVNGGNGTLGLTEDVIEIAVSNTGEGTTRAARPMGSSAAANNVDIVELKFYVSNDGSTWSDASGLSITDANTGSDYTVSGLKISWTDTNYASEETPTLGDNESGIHIERTANVKVAGLVAGKKYRIVAYGYDQSMYAGSASATDGGLYTTNTINVTNPYTDIYEVFAGYDDAETPAAPVNEDGEQQQVASVKFTSMPKVTLTRQVAGMLAYFKVPIFYNDKKVEKVQVVAGDKTQAIKYPASLLTQNQEFNGVSNLGQEDILMEFDMSKADNYSTPGSDTHYKFANGGKAENYTGPTNLKILADAVFGARYILPYANTVDENTMVVKLLGGEEGKEVLKTLTVKSDQGSLGSKFDIRVNNFYSIGHKVDSDTTGGGEGDPDPDEPIDLGATDIVLLEINDAWSVFHSMTVE